LEVVVVAVTVVDLIAFERMFGAVVVVVPVSSPNQILQVVVFSSYPFSLY
jgi:hypothetical protein